MAQPGLEAGWGPEQLLKEWKLVLGFPARTGTSWVRGAMNEKQGCTDRKETRQGKGITTEKELV